MRSVLLGLFMLINICYGQLDLNIAPKEAIRLLGIENLGYLCIDDAKNTKEAKDADLALLNALGMLRDHSAPSCKIAVEKTTPSLAAFIRQSGIAINSSKEARKEAKEIADERFIGVPSDRYIALELRNAFKARVFSDLKVLGALNHLIDEKIISGYNIVDTEALPRFSKELSLRYGHSSLGHLDELVYLMRLLGLDPKLALEVKGSGFLYLPMWGEASYPTMELSSGNKIALAKEYNLDLRFSSLAEKKRFYAMVTRYAKRNSKDEKGLIKEAWWQPFIRSEVPFGSFKRVDEIHIAIGSYQIEIVSLPSKTKRELKYLREVYKDIKVVKTYVNKAFYRYMLGGYK